MITKEQREAAKAAIDATEPTDEDMRLLTNVVTAFSALQEMPPKKLVNIALRHMPIMPIHYEQIVEELCTRVHPNWPNETDELTANAGVKITWTVEPGGVWMASASDAKDGRDT